MEISNLVETYEALNKSREVDLRSRSLGMKI